MEVQVPLVIFTLLLCVANGLMGFQGYLMVTQKGSIRLHLTTLVTTAIVLVVGGLAVFTHLEHWERIFNGFGHITSGITHELILVVVMAIALVAAFILLRKVDKQSSEEPDSVQKAEKETTEETADKGTEKGAFPYKGFGIAFIVIAVVGGFVTAHSYDMYARPAWNNVFLYLYYYSSELILGAAGTWTLVVALKEPEQIGGFFSKATAILAIASAVVCIAAMLFIANIQPTTIEGITFYTYDPTHPAANPASDLAAGVSGSAALIFWLGAVIVGCAIPAVMSVLSTKKPELADKIALPAIALVTALIGGVCYRVVLYVVGIASYVYFF